MDVSVVPATVPSYESGRAVVPNILASRATAVLTFDDLTAQGVMTGLADLGVSVPNEISIVGCDDVHGATTYPSLTTVSNRSDEAGRASMALLLDMLNSRAERTAPMLHDWAIESRYGRLSPSRRPPS